MTKGSALLGVAGCVIALSLGGSLAAGEPPADPAAAAYAEIEKTFGTIPGFVKQFPKAAIAGAWAEERDLELSDTTALSAKEKALISLAVAAQIPCQYCVWLDTRTARGAGATDEEVSEAVAIAALTRHWSTVFNGLGIDFETFKAELGGN